ncbi:MAG TPA: signal peptidase I [Bacillales bacterium]|nr:signal peptidase I [Bacillales bacterium]
MKAFGRITTFLFLAGWGAVILYFQFGTPPFAAIPSTSMIPTFRVGDLVWVEPVSPEKVQKGDVIVVHVPESVRNRFKSYPETIIHRVVEKKQVNGQLQFRIKGDHNGGQDPFTVLPEDIMGIAGKSFHWLGYPILFLSSKQGFYFLLSFCLIYVVFMLYDEYKKREKQLRRGFASLFFGEMYEKTVEIDENQRKLLQWLAGKELASSCEADGFADRSIETDISCLRKRIEREALHQKDEKKYARLLELVKAIEQQVDQTGERSTAVDGGDTEKVSLPPRREKKKRKRFKKG